MGRHPAGTLRRIDQGGNPADDPGMLRIALIAALVSGALLSPAGAQAPERAPAQSGDWKAPAKPARPNTLDDLFARLAAAGDEAEAKGIAGLIERRFSQSGSPTADLLMARSGEALSAKDAALAVELLDRVTRLKPDWAEAWSRRAAAFYMLDDTAGAMADIRQALSQEPRHFDSWAALGHVEMAGGNKKRALEAFRRALDLHPFMPGLREIVDKLGPEIDGRDL
jgi:tetratricopeptide (TPR) repeat protein